MAQRILKNRVFNTKRKPSKADPSLIKLGFTALLYLALIHQTSAQIDQIISEQESKSVVLQCPVNEDKCGKLHSLNWFKGDDRIAAMLLGENNATSVNKDFEERVTVDTSPYRLVIKDLKISDEGTYLCDTTFFIPEETCDNFNGYRVDLRVLVPPSEVFILDAKGDRIENGTTVGPMQERQSLKATCTVKNTRPQPEVGWFRGTKRLTTYSPTHNLNDGLYTSTLELDWTLSRDDLAQDIECRVNSAAILNSIVSTFGVDLQVRPTSIEINGVEHHTVQGSKVVLTCDIHGARPAVNLTWYNSTSIISADENDLTEIRIKAFEKIDGTYHTQSELIFNATRFENDRVFRCEAENIVLQINREKPISSALTLEVLYPPVVKVSPPDMVTNTSEIVLLNCEYVANPASLIQVDWYRNDELLNVNDTDHYQGGNSENVALVIKSTDKDDIGNYSCQLSNTIGKGISEEKINLDVQFVPSVEVQMIPAGPVKESDESNVTLYCNILDANPSVLTKVRWYANSTLLKELPDCEETREDLCHIDPSKLLLESIGRGFFYNYSCEGFNAAGWGPRSEDKELIVHYEPGPATLTHFPLIAVKKKSVIFSCSVDDPGYPDSNRFVAQQAKHIQKITKTQYPPLIDFHTVQALQPQEADIALEAFMLQKQQERLRSNAPSHSYSKNETASASHQVHQLKETHALIDFSLNQSLCTLLTLTTYTSQLQILTLYSDEHKNSISNASALSYSLYRKMGKFSFVAQLVSKPNRYRWLRGGRGPLQDVVTKDWTVEPVGLDSRTNYSCYAYNEGGKGLMATVNLEVHAPPFFIKNLAPYTGILHTSSNATLTCRIECVPRCDIHWQKDGVLIERNNSRYFVKEKYMEASPATGDFESILSVLHFNMPNWPRNKFDIDADNANYSCTSTPNTVGAGIKSATYFSIEYSPDNTTVSENITFVQEDTVPGRLICKSRANPEPSYKWFFKNETIGNGNALIINTAMKRSDNGTYTCLAYNKHGSSRAETVIIVQFTPNCEIERREIDGQDTLICTAFGNPEEADFSWSIKAENETVELLGSGDKKDSLDKSYYILQEGYAIARTYRCVANNTVGSGSFCEFEVAEQLAWWQIWEKTTLIVLVAAILGLLLIVIIICCIIICVCRRRRRQDKLHDKSSSLGEPLTEPGEYENLPFHGLQTAPNKFSATPTSFNNNTNMEHFVPRSERLHGDITKNGKSNDSGNNNKGNLRRQTISDPYFHIKRQPYGALAPDNPTRLSEEWQIKNTTSNATSKIAARSNEENNERLLEPRKWLVEKPRLNYVPHKEDFPAQILPEVLKEPLEGVHYDYLVSSRPIRLPLRKHHTFHFQNSQTANGKLHQLRQQLQHHLRDRIKFEQENGFSYCPLQHVFKPISPIPSVTASIEEFKTKKKGELSSSEQEYDHYSKEADDDEDPGYSFCEEESIVDNDNYPTLDNLKSYS
ncbi:hemicentin-1 isoform X4 [Drosophila kikkawai]|uniref:Hemicentin-1 isoform X4 n=1 Tax=Drosophila kikkawai TaxID=30033 RepID=A0ABM4GES5_DROKI